MATTDHRPRVAAERRERMRARLLDSALTLAAERGPAAVSIDDVIAAAQVSRGTFYKYFDAPATLFRALGAEVGGALIGALDPLVQALPDPAESMAAGMRSSLRLVRAHPVLGAFIVRSGWPVVQADHPLFTQVGRDLARGMRQGRFARMHADVALNLVAGLTIGGMQAVVAGRVPRDFPEQAAAAMLRGLGLPADEAAALAARPLAAPVIAADSLISRLMAPRPA